MHFIHTFKGVNHTLLLLHVEDLLEMFYIKYIIFCRLIHLFNSTINLSTGIVSEMYLAEVFLIYRKIDDKWSQQILFELPES